MTLVRSLPVEFRKYSMSKVNSINYCCQSWKCHVFRDNIVPRNLPVLLLRPCFLAFALERFISLYLLPSLNYCVITSQDNDLTWDWRLLFRLEWQKGKKGVWILQYLAYPINVNFILIRVWSAARKLFVGFWALIFSSE